MFKDASWLLLQFSDWTELGILIEVSLLLKQLKELSLVSFTRYKSVRLLLEQLSCVISVK